MAKLNLEYCSITSPVDGRAGNILVDPGNLIKASDAALVTINQISPIYVFFNVTQEELLAIKARMAQAPLKVEVRVDEADDNAEVGKLTFVDNTISTGTVQLGAVFENPRSASGPASTSWSS